MHTVGRILEVWFFIYGVNSTFFDLLYLLPGGKAFDE